MTEIEFIQNISILELKPDDIVILKHPGILSQNAHNQLKDSLHKIFDDLGILNKVIIFDENMDIGILRKIEE